MDVIAWNDIDIDISNKNMNTQRLYDLTRYITESFSPVWYEAKCENSPDGKQQWFHGFEAVIGGELWNIDIWFLDDKIIAETKNTATTFLTKSRMMTKLEAAL